MRLRAPRDSLLASKRWYPPSMMNTVTPVDHRSTSGRVLLGRSGRSRLPRPSVSTPTSPFFPGALIPMSASTSGAAYSTVPWSLSPVRSFARNALDRRPSGPDASVANPKSASLSVRKSPGVSSSKFSSLTSLCTNPRSCRCDRACARRRTAVTASASVKAPPVFSATLAAATAPARSTPSSDGPTSTPPW